MAGGGAGEIGDLALDPHRGQPGLEQHARLAVQPADGIDRRRRPAPPKESGGPAASSVLIGPESTAFTRGLPAVGIMGRFFYVSAPERSMRIIQEALTFDDVLLVPALLRRAAARRQPLAPSSPASIRLNIPLLSAAMDTVTEARLAIAMAQEGGIGIIHKNMTLEPRPREVRDGQEVRERRRSATRSRSRPTPPSARCIELTRAHNISGVPVVDGDAAGRHRHQPRPALRDPARRAGVHAS